MNSNYRLLVELSQENEEELFVGDLDSYTDTMSDFEDK